MSSALTGDKCDRLASLTMQRLADKHGIDVGDINTDIKTHPALMHSLMMAAFELGRMVEAELGGADSIR